MYRVLMVPRVVNPSVTTRQNCSSRDTNLCHPDGRATLTSVILMAAQRPEDLLLRIEEQQQQKQKRCHGIHGTGRNDAECFHAQLRLGTSTSPDERFFGNAACKRRSEF